MSDDDKPLTLTSVSSTMKDLHPLPGTVLKQWVVDHRRELDWEDATCPKFQQPEHLDDTLYFCATQYSPIAWNRLDGYECQVCEDAYERLRSHPLVVAWLAEKAKRPPIESDRSKLSTEVAPDFSYNSDHPLMAMLPRGKP
jgi:hypothetical protein